MTPDYFQSGRFDTQEGISVNYVLGQIAFYESDSKSGLVRRTCFDIRTTKETQTLVGFIPLDNIHSTEMDHL